MKWKCVEYTFFKPSFIHISAWVHFGQARVILHSFHIVRNFSFRLQYIMCFSLLLFFLSFAWISIQICWFVLHLMAWYYFCFLFISIVLTYFCLFQYLTSGFFLFFISQYHVKIFAWAAFIWFLGIKTNISK